MTQPTETPTITFTRFEMNILRLATQAYLRTDEAQKLIANEHGIHNKLGPAVHSTVVKIESAWNDNFNLDSLGNPRN